jgi:cobalt/nickel transport system ATP-binding protein
MAHLSLPTLLELHMELQKRGFLLLGKKPRTVLDMMHCIETLFEKTGNQIKYGTITVCNVDRDNGGLLSAWLTARRNLSVGAMGTRAKLRAENLQICLDFTYGVIDKCILKALLGEDSLILTTESMVRRVYQRVDAYGQVSGIIIPVQPFETIPGTANSTSGDPS